MKAQRATSWTDDQLRHFFSRSRRFLSNTALDIKLAPQASSSGHLLVVTPKKMGSAPQRNLFRRRVKAIFYEQKLGQVGFDIAIYAKPAAVHMSFVELKAAILGALQQAQAIQLAPHMSKA